MKRNIINIALCAYFSGNLNRHKKEKHGITDTTQSTEEEAAKILNEMSTRKVYNNDMAHDETTQDDIRQDEITQDGITQDDIRQDGFVEQDETGYSSEGMSTPKKKRKSAPPRKSFTQVRFMRMKNFLILLKFKVHFFKICSVTFYIWHTDFFGMVLMKWLFECKFV